jgi:hypothetical protein
MKFTGRRGCIIECSMIIEQEASRKFWGIETRRGTDPKGF